MTMSENKTEIIRKKIMNQFLRTLVWIDDEIHPDRTDELGNLFRCFFYPIAQEFQKCGLLVHLHPYASDISGDIDDTFSSRSNSFDSALELAKKADIVILDWHLAQENPRNSIQLLKDLSREPAIRYIIVLSTFAREFEEKMRMEGMLVNESVNSGQSHLFRNEGDTWMNDTGTYIIVMDKSAFDSENPNIFCDSIIDNVYALMIKAHPDYLHWAAIEIAAKFRHFMPGWIQAIPSGTDAAVLSELISDKTEARNFIPAHLLEDLSNISELYTLESLALENCRREHWLNKAYEVQDIGIEERYKKITHFLLPASKIKEKDVTDLFGNITGEDHCPCRKFVEAQRAFAGFCEKISSVSKPFPTFGAIYKSLESTATQDTETQNGATGTIYLCLSQECDSLRKKNLLLLKGTVDNGSSAEESVIRLSYLGETFVFLPKAENLRTVNVLGEKTERRLDGYEKIGHLRKATVRRILSRFWNYMSRSAVNLPRFTLVERDEDERFILRGRSEDENGD